MPDFLLFILIIGGLILGHEFGHFVAAKLLGVRVDEFGLGFPPRIVTLFKAAGTRFSINLLPLGGFVRLAGEDDPSIEGGLASANKRTRAAVLLAGPLANVIIAFLAFTSAYRYAAPDFNRVMITAVEPRTPAEMAGILPGDLIISVDETPIVGFETMSAAVSKRLGEKIQIILERNGERITIALVPRTEYPEGQGPIGVTMGNPTREVGWGEAASIGLQSAFMQFNEIIHLPSKLIKGEIEPEEARLTGFKGMYDMISWAGAIDRSAQRPFLTLNLIGIIGIGLAIANLLPFPALDGGRLLFILIEIVLGRRLEPRYEGLAHTIGFFLLIVIFIYVNYLDFVNPISLP